MKKRRNSGRAGRLETSSTSRTSPDRHKNVVGKKRNKLEKRYTGASDDVVVTVVEHNHNKLNDVRQLRQASKSAASSSMRWKDDNSGSRSSVCSAG